MATPSCNQCPSLRAQVNDLTRRVDFLRRTLAALRGGVRATVEFIDQEQAEPTMPRRTVIPSIQNRLTYALDLAEGKN